MRFQGGCEEHNATTLAFSEVVSTYSLGQRTALADSNPVTLRDTEGRGDVSGEVLVTLLVPLVLGNEVEIFTANDQSTVHLGRDDAASQDTTADGDLAGEGALLVCWSC